ncbi:hypothetical protein P154DRAFT_35117 [Amniculicola lignicola CBS 123094]|uniref:Zn(2)-C6 fungal-type domain-containing protein n=1 Tax=Amniculicola lignicola CBS 123094 TaxID=1392246 RepID=A0A6A5WRX9_9PLEO|nr:hypothetical protein P154DRAFT_35117 [Amniculicola lignicola CBS 123094]
MQPIATTEHTTPCQLPQTSSNYPNANTHNPYARMSQRRAIACTICAKAKTKCDKAVPSCSRCTAKGLQCEPRSTRRTSDSNYRNPKKAIVSPKRFHSAQPVSAISRHGSPRSVPSHDRHHQLVRAVSHMDMATMAKLQQRPDYTGMPMLTPLPTFSPQIIDECYPFSSSPEQQMGAFANPMEKSSYLASGRLTPQTPESFIYSEPLAMNDGFDYMNAQPWDNGQMPVGLGFESDIPGMMPVEPDMRMWSSPDLDGGVAAMVPMSQSMCDSPESFNAWSNSSLSVSPPQLPHTRAVPSLSLSDCSAQDYDSPNAVQEEWAKLNGTMNKSSVSTMYFNDMKVMQHHAAPLWEDVIIPRTSTF